MCDDIEKISYDTITIKSTLFHKNKSDKVRNIWTDFLSLS